MALKTRVIPVLLLRNEKLVQSRRFARYSIIGDPWTSVKRLNSWSSDEIVYLDITFPNQNELHKSNRMSLLEHVAKSNHCPLAFGGGIRSLREAKELLRGGADKVVVNSLIFENPLEVKRMVDAFGSQAVIASLDFKVSKSYFALRQGGRQPGKLHLEEAVDRVQEVGCGEILVNSIDQDGTGQGYDLSLIKQVTLRADIPVIAMGGVGEWDHFCQAIEDTKVSAVAAANIFHHSENSMFRCKKHLLEKGFNVRSGQTLSSAEGPI